MSFLRRNKNKDILVHKHFDSIGKNSSLFFPHDFNSNLFRNIPSISEDANSIIIEAQVPGLSARELEVFIDEDNALNIIGSTNSTSEDKKRKFYSKSQKHFSYKIPLGKTIDETIAPEASCINGVVKIAFAKKTEVKPSPKKRKIQIKGK